MMGPAYILAQNICENLRMGASVLLAWLRAVESWPTQQIDLTYTSSIFGTGENDCSLKLIQCLIAFRENDSR